VRVYEPARVPSISRTRAGELDTALRANERPSRARETFGLVRADVHDVRAIQVNLARIEARWAVDLELIDDAAGGESRRENDDDDWAHESSLIRPPTVVFRSEINLA
jgi:hypothetical protein